MQNTPVQHLNLQENCKSFMQYVISYDIIVGVDFP